MSSGRESEGDFNIETINTDFRTEGTSSHWLMILDQLVFRNMPPGDQEQPEPDEIAKVTQWINQELIAAGKGDIYRKKLLAPEYGNWVNHEQLFSEQFRLRPTPPSRLWRFSPGNIS